MTGKTRVVIIDDDLNVGKSLSYLLEAEGYDPFPFFRYDDAALQTIAEGCACVLLDLFLGVRDGRDVLKDILSRSPGLPVVMLSGQASPEDSVECVRAGAFDFVEKPFAPERLLLTLGNAIRFGELNRKTAIEAMPILVSGAIKEVYALAMKYAQSRASLLITGESGTGKDVVATLVHKLSPRCAKPFVKLNCGAIPVSLADSELFGHAKGSFTGADREYEGKLRAADWGTLFLDEVGELPPDVQVKLLRFLESGEVQRIGDRGTRTFDVRVIAATNRDISEMIRTGKFREDLYYRLAVLSIRVPPLRERQDDVIPLAEWFLGSIAAREGVSPPELSPDARLVLLDGELRGNARELKSAMERISCGVSGRVVSGGEMTAALGDPGTRLAPVPVPSPDGGDPSLFSANTTLAEAKETLEREFLRVQYAMHGKSVKETAEAIGVLPNNLSRRMKQLGLPTGA